MLKCQKMSLSLFHPLPQEPPMKEIRLTDGPILSNLIRFSLPMILGNILQQIYGFVDAVIVGQCISSDALAAVGGVTALMIFLNSLIIGLCMGSGALFAADCGAGKKDELYLDVRYSFGFILSVTVLLLIIVFPLADRILQLLRTPAGILGLSRTYLTAILCGMGFVFLYNFFAYLLRAVGESKIPLLFLGLSSLLNVGLDLLFVAVFRRGIGGAAWATVVSQGVSAVGIAIYAARHPVCSRGGLPRRGFDGKRLKHIAANDIFTGLQQSVMNFGILLIQGLVNSFGTVVMAAFAAAVRIDTIAYMPAQEFANGYSLFTSQNFGAGKPERVREGTKKAALVSLAFCLLVSGCIAVFARELMLLFIAPEETAILQEGVRYLRIEGACYVGIGMLFLLYGYFRAVGRPQISLLLTVVSLGTRVALSYALSPLPAPGVTIIWWSIPIGWALADITGFVIMRREKRYS